MSTGKKSDDTLQGMNSVCVGGSVYKPSAPESSIGEAAGCVIYGHALGPVGQHTDGFVNTLCRLSSDNVHGQTLYAHLTRQQMQNN